MVPEVAHSKNPALIECCTKESASAAIAVDAAGTAVMLSTKPMMPVMSAIKASATRSFSIIAHAAFGGRSIPTLTAGRCATQSRNEHVRARGCPRMKRLMGEPRIGELEALIDGDLHRARGDDREKVI